MSSAIAEALRSRLPRYLGVVVSLGLATATWLYCLQTIFSPKLDDYVATGPPAKFTKALANHQLAVWRDPVRQAAELTRMRATNAEWDFMSRSFLVWSLANMGLQEPERKLEYLEIMDTIISATLDLEREHGPLYFLMGYGAEQPFLYSPPRSLFVDGEIALMLAARRMLEERADYRPLLQERVATMIARMQQSPVLSGESYPNESWTFCNTVALASIRAADILDGTDHSSFIRQWI